MENLNDSKNGLVLYSLIMSSKLPKADYYDLIINNPSLVTTAQL